MSNRAALWILSALLLLQATVHWLSRASGPLSVDEVAYHFMTRAVADGHPSEVFNAYREHPSAALEVPITRAIVAHEGRLVAKYPYLLPWLAAALYPWFGFDSLILVNLMAHSAVLGLTWWLARYFLRSSGWALAAPILLSVATHFWEYAEGAWPHSLAMAFSTAAFACAVKCRASASAGGAPKSALVWALASGALAGLGAGARLDVILWVFIAAALLCGLRRGGLLLALVAGASLGVALLALDNYGKFGFFWPFTYRADGSALLATYGRYAPLLAVAVALTVAILVAGSGRAAAWVPSLRRFSAAAAIAVGLLLLLWAPARTFYGGLFDIAVDLSALDPSRVEPAMQRTTSGAVMYFGHYKKALLQSCPYLALLVVPVLRRRATPAGEPSLWPLYVPLGVLLTVFATRSWHGGLGLNMRYLLPALPMTSVLTVWAMREIRPVHKLSWALLVASASLTLLVYLLLPLPPGTALELKLLAMPVLLAGVLFAACLGAEFVARAGTKRLFESCRLLLATSALCWAALTSLAYDYPAQRALRSYNAESAALVRERIEQDSLLFVQFIDPFSKLIDAERVRLANPFQDNLVSLVPLASHHLGFGRAVYGVFSGPGWERVIPLARAAGLRVGNPERLSTGFILATFFPADEAHAGAQPPRAIAGPTSE